MTQKPSRPLSAYNLFFHDERQRIQEEVLTTTGKKAQFTEVSKLVGSRWRSLSTQDKKYYQALAAKEKRRFALAILNWQIQQESITPENQETLQGPMPSVPEATTPSALSTAHTDKVHQNKYGTSPHLSYAYREPTAPLLLPTIPKPEAIQTQHPPQTMERYTRSNDGNQHNELSLVDKLKALICLADQVRLFNQVSGFGDHPIEVSADQFQGNESTFSLSLDHEDVLFLENAFDIQHDDA